MLYNIIKRSEIIDWANEAHVSPQIVEQAVAENGTEVIADCEVPSLGHAPHQAECPCCGAPAMYPTPDGWAECRNCWFNTQPVELCPSCEGIMWGKKLEGRTFLECNECGNRKYLN